MSTMHLLAAGDDMQWAIYALGAITIIYVVFVRPSLKRKKDPLAKAPSLGLSQQRAVEREMNNLLVELSEMARQITAQLDTRSAKLEMLIEEADRKIAELKRLSADALPEQPSAPPPAPESRLEPPVPDARYADIYELADQGKEPQEIARQLNRPRGEIELILALRRTG